MKYHLRFFRYYLGLRDTLILQRFLSRSIKVIFTFKENTAQGLCLSEKLL